MKIVWKRSLSVILALLLLSTTLFIFTEDVNAEDEERKEVTGKPFRVGPAEFYLRPDVWENRLVYADETRYDVDIFLFDLDNMTEIQLTSEPGDQKGPKIWGDNIIWEYWDYSETNIYLYNLQTGGPVQITPAGSSQRIGGIWQDRIVWADYRHTNPSIYLYNITTGTEERILDIENGFRGLPDIYGDKIVYTDDRDDDTDYEVYLYDISTDTDRGIALHSYSNQYPKIHGNFIVYKQVFDDLDRTYVKVKDLDGEFRSTLSPDVDLTITNVDIYNNKVVWGDTRTGLYEIYLYDLDSGIEKQITDNIPLDHDVHIHGDRLVWSGDTADSRCLMTLLLDEDGDGVSDSKDAFPLNPMDYKDTDGDGIGDNMDEDRDGDRVPDLDDEFVLDPTEWNDFDNDGIGDNEDKDDDNDGIPDMKDEEPKNPVNGILDGIDSLRKDIDFISDGIGLLSDDIEYALNRIIDLNLSTKELNSTIKRVHQSNLVIEDRLDDVISNLTDLFLVINESLPVETNLSGLLKELDTIKMMLERMDHNVTNASGSPNELEMLLEEYESISEEINRLLNNNEQLDQLETDLEGLERENKDTQNLVESGNLILYIIIFVLMIIVILLVILLIRTGKRETIDVLE